MHDGEEAWRVAVPAPVESLRLTGETLLVGTADAVVAMTETGTEPRRQSTDGATRFATAAGRVVVNDGSRLTARRLPSGERLWPTRAELPGGLPAMTAERVYVVTASTVRTYDAETGDTGWRGGGASRLGLPLVPSPEGVYAAEVGARHWRSVGMVSGGPRSCRSDRANSSAGGSTAKGRVPLRIWGPHVAPADGSRPRFAVSAALATGLPGSISTSLTDLTVELRGIISS